MFVLFVFLNNSDLVCPRRACLKRTWLVLPCVISAGNGRSDCEYTHAPDCPPRRFSQPLFFFSSSILHFFHLNHSILLASLPSTWRVDDAGALVRPSGFPLHGEPLEISTPPAFVSVIIGLRSMRNSPLRNGDTRVPSFLFDGMFSQLPFSQCDRPESPSSFVLVALPQNAPRRLSFNSKLFRPPCK